MKLLSRKLRLVIALSIIFIGVLIIVFNSKGWISYLRLKDEVNSLQVKIDSMQTENKNLEAEIDSLNRKIPAKIERTAREKYDMLREGETKVEVIEK